MPMNSKWPKFIFFTALMIGLLASPRPLWAIGAGLIGLWQGVKLEEELAE